MTESLRLCSDNGDLEAQVIIMFLDIAIMVCLGVRLGFEKLCERYGSKLQSI